MAHSKEIIWFNMNADVIYNNRIIKICTQSYSVILCIISNTCVFPWMFVNVGRLCRSFDFKFQFSQQQQKWVHKCLPKLHFSYKQNYVNSTTIMLLIKLFAWNVHCHVNTNSILCHQQYFLSYIIDFTQEWMCFLIISLLFTDSFVYLA